MAWTAPRTWTTGELVTASIMNTHVRDDLLETGPAKVTTAGDLLYATAANALARLGIGTKYQHLRVNSGATAPEWGGMSGARVALSGDFAIGSSQTWTEVTWDVEAFDTDAYHDNAVNNARLTAPVTGYYLVVANLAFNTQNANRCSARLDVGGNVRAIQTLGSPLGSDPLVDGVSLGVLTQLTASTDYARVLVWATGTTSTLESSYSNFGIVFLGT